MFNALNITMARFLSLSTVSGVLLCGITSSGCLISPPIDLEDPRENSPPFIHEDRVSPGTTRVVASGDSNVTLSVDTLYDPDNEEELEYAWYSPTLGTLRTGTAYPVAGQDEDQLSYGIFYSFDGPSYVFSPCQSALQGRQSETVWLYVTDGELQFTSNEGVQIDPDKGGFIISWSWVIDLGDVVCGG